MVFCVNTTAYEAHQLYNIAKLVTIISVQQAKSIGLVPVMGGSWPTLLLSKVENLILST